MDLKRLLHALAQYHGSDLHLQAESPPTVRVNGLLAPLQAPPLTAEDIADTLSQVSTEAQRARLERDRSADFGYLVPDLARFRVNAFYERGRLCLAFRLVPLAVPTFDELNLPPVLKEIAKAERGIVLVTGTTSSGKSTTLAATVDFLNQNERLRIITIEDPIEFVHTSKKSLVAQREVGDDVPGFLEALRRALREDPNVILVGELRDVETMRTALQAADTGHLVLSTVHTTNAAQTVQRIIALFPPDERDLLLTQLSANLEAVISQRLARTRDGKGRVPVVEVLRSSPIVRKMIAENRPTALPQAIANQELGMQLFDQHLAALYRDKVINGTEALRLATNPEAVALAMRGITSGDTAHGLVR
jgi:twitching motility protein PilT